MAKKQAQKQGFNWKMILGLVVVGGIAYVYLGGSDTSSTTKATTAATQRKSTNADGFTDVDYKAQFGVLKVEAKDAFLPLVSKKTVGDLTAPPGGIPGEITGGGEWMYTGMVIIDGRPQALLEDIKAGASEYVALGEHWKKAKIKRISDSDIEFLGDDAKDTVVKMGEPPEASAKNPADNPLAPATLQGPIGGGSQLDITPLPGINQNPGGGRRRGRRGGGFNQDPNNGSGATGTVTSDG